jgi:Zn-dependent M28 family amino/carboxypeptidase
LLVAFNPSETAQPMDAHGYDPDMPIVLGRTALIFLLLVTPLVAQGPSLAGDEQARWWGHVKTLADDALEGRQTGSAGYRKAAAYVVEQFERAGLKPAGAKGYLQTVQFSRRRIIEDQSQLALVRDGKEDVLRFGDDVAVNLRAELTPSVEAPLVFAGYGLSAPEVGHDDLAGLDLTGKVVVYITGTPANITGALAAHYQQAGVRWQALAASGAIGSIAISNPKTVEQSWEQTAPRRLNPVMTLVDPRFNDLAGMKVAAAVNPASAERIFAGSGHSFAALLAIAEDKKALPRFPLPASLRARVTLESTSIESDNVAALLPGGDPALAAEHVVLTAHLDHVGVGAAVNGDRIYNGAMDNASGIATLIEVARQLSAATARPRRSILFVAVTAEEHGLLGSRYFAGDPTVPKGSIVANINMDMFLPLFPMSSVMVLGLDESDLGDRVREVAARSGLEVAADPQPERNRFTRSDQYSFIRQGVPALAMKVGFEPGSPEAAIDAAWTKERYHAPTDDLQQPIDLGAATAFTRLVGALSAEVANHPARPRWKPGSFFRRFETRDAVSTGDDSRRSR